MSNIVRVLQWFEKAPRDELVGEAVISGVELSELQRLFGVPSNNPMYDCWLVGLEQAATLSGLAGVSIELDRFDYLVTAYSTSEE